VPQQSHVVDAVGAGDHTDDKRGHLGSGVGALVGRDAQVLVGKPTQSAEPANANIGSSPAEDTKFGSNTAAVAPGV
jgi:hypothetical protein